MVTPLPLGAGFGQRAADRPLQIRPGVLDLRRAVDVVEMHLLQASQGVEKREEVYRARRIRALRDLDRLLGLWKMRAHEEVVAQPRRPDPQPRLLDVTADRI